MHYRTFLAANVAGALVSGIGFTLLGYFAGHALHTVEKYSTYGASALLVIAIVVAVVLHRLFQGEGTQARTRVGSHPPRRLTRTALTQFVQQLSTDAQAPAADRRLQQAFT
jgi:cytochrome c biogenesis protein CcdA